MAAPQGADHDAGGVGPTGLPRVAALAVPMLLAIVTAWAYAGAFGAPFIYDDYNAIVDNPHIRALWPLGRVLTAPDQSTLAGRPLVALSFALNYAISGLAPWSYHLGNLLIHLVGGLALFGLVRRTLELPNFTGVHGTDGIPARAWGLAAAAWWLLHPVQTEAVTYISTRTESLMGACALLSLYCLVRSAGSRRAGWWQGGCVVACAAAMASKEVAVAVPLVLLAYDAVFLSDGVGTALRRRSRLYAGLAGTWLILLGLLAGTPRSETVGLHLPGLSPLDYLRTQVGVIWHYLRLAVWPAPLALDYFDWPVAHGFTPAVVIGGAALLGLAIGSVWLAARRRSLGFLGLWFLLLLAPTSSVVPIFGEVAAERRLYLPLAAVVVAVLAVLWRGLMWLGERPRKIAFGAVATVVAVALAGATAARNRVYASEVDIWRDAVRKRPANSRALVNLATALVKTGQRNEAAELYRRALMVDPSTAGVFGGDHEPLPERGHRPEDSESLRQLVGLNPSVTDALENLALIRLDEGRAAEAVQLLEHCVELHPEDAVTRINLAGAYRAAGDRTRAEQTLRVAIQLAPDQALAPARLAMLLAERGAVEESARLIATARRLAPHDPTVQGIADQLAEVRGGADGTGRRRGEAVSSGQAVAEDRLDRVVALRRAGRVSEADDLLAALAGEITDPRPLLQLVEHGLTGPEPGVGRDLLHAAVRLRPSDPDLRFALGRVLAAAGDASAALAEYREALRLRPGWGDVGNSLALLLATADDPAVRDPAAALRIASQLDAAAGHAHPQLRATLAVALAAAGRHDDAVAVIGEAIALARASGQDLLVPELERYRSMLAQGWPDGAGG